MSQQIMIAAAVIFSLLILGVGGYFIYKKMKESPSSPGGGGNTGGGTTGGSSGPPTQWGCVQTGGTTAGTRLYTCTSLPASGPMQDGSTTRPAGGPYIISDFRSATYDNVLPSYSYGGDNYWWRSGA